MLAPIKCYNSDYSTPAKLLLLTDKLNRLRKVFLVYEDSLWNIYIVLPRTWYYAKGHLNRMQMEKVIVVLAVVWCHLYISNECFLLNKVGLAHL